VGMPDALKEDGSLDGYIQSDLVHPSEDDPQSAMFLERLGIKSDDLEAGFVIAAMMNINSDEIILLQAKDDSKVEELEAALKKELEAQTSTWEQYLPDQYEKVKNNIIKTKGNYLIYITYEDPEALDAVFDEKLKQVNKVPHTYHLGEALIALITIHGCGDMVFSSLLFLFFFLPVTLLLYFCSP